MDTFPELPYSPEYISLLQEIKAGMITYEDMTAPETPEEEHNQRVILDGIIMKRENQEIKRILSHLSLAFMQCPSMQGVMSLSGGVSYLVWDTGHPVCRTFSEMIRAGDWSGSWNLHTYISLLLTTTFDMSRSQLGNPDSPCVGQKQS